MDQYVGQAILGQAMHGGGDGFAAAHLGGDDDFPLPFRLDRQQAEVLLEDHDEHGDEPSDEQNDEKANQSRNEGEHEI